jgi:hypothetical protein
VCVWKFFRRRGFFGFETSCLDMLKPWSSEIYLEALRGRNFLWPFLNLLDNLSSKMMFLKIQEIFSEHEIRVFLEKGHGSFQTFLILQFWNKPDVLKTFQKPFWKLDLKPKKPRILGFRKIPCDHFPKPLKEGIFSVSGIFIEHYLMNLTFWEKSKNRFWNRKSSVSYPLKKSSM